MAGWVNAWNRVQRGEDLDVVELAHEMWGVDVSSYIKPKSGKTLKRFRRERTGHDGTAMFTIQALQKLIVPMLRREVYDKSNGEPAGQPSGIIYYVSPVIHHSFMTTGQFSGGWSGLMLKETFYMRYTSEWVYE